MLTHRERNKRFKRREGAIVQIPLGNNKVGYGMLLKEPLIAFYDQEFDEDQHLNVEDLLQKPIMFTIMVMNHAVTSGRWSTVGNIPIPDKLKEPPAFFKRDKISGQLSIYREIDKYAPHFEYPARFEDCIGLEAAAIWEPEHVEERIRDHFDGRPNIWLEHLSLKASDDGTAVKLH